MNVFSIARVVLVAAMLCQAAQAQPPARLSLQCSGWLPDYSTWETPPVPAEAPRANLRVEIDRGARRLATTLAPTGELVADLEVSDRYYSATAALGRMVFSRSLDGVEIRINRQTGASQLRYLVGETSYPAFVGTCAPASSRS